VVFHQNLKAFVVAGFQQVEPFVNDNVFQAFARLFGQFGIQTNLACGGITALH
jgi:hypothetical protein